MQAQAFVTGTHPRAAAITTRQHKLTELHAQAVAACVARRAALDGAVKWHVFLGEADALEQWMRAKQPETLSRDCGRNLVSNAHVRRNVHALTLELAAYKKSHVTPVLASGMALMTAGHVFATAIEARATQMSETFTALVAQAEARKAHVALATLRFQYEADANEAESWMNEREPLLSSDDYGATEEGTSRLLRSHGVLERDLAGFHDTTLAALLHQSDAVCADLAAAAVETARQHKEAAAKHQHQQHQQPSAQSADAEVFDDDFGGSDGEGDEAFAAMFRAAVTTGVPNAAQGAPAVHSPQPPRAKMVSEVQQQQPQPQQQSDDVAATAVAAGDDDAVQAVRRRKQELDLQYSGLVSWATDRRRQLMLALQAHELLREATDAESWMHSQEAVVQASECGNDLEQTQALVKKFGVFGEELAANAERLVRIDKLKAALAGEGYTLSAPLQDRLHSLDAHWVSLQNQVLSVC
jgi:hypothetical protein